ncbi:MAG: ATP-binding protein [Betaproteobacteria bacterium]
MVSTYAGPAEPFFFSGNRLFEGLPADLVKEFGAQMALMRFEEGERIFNEGDAGDCLYLLCKGSVRISKTGRGGQQETLGFIEAGHFFGEMALIDGQPRSAQATAAGQPTVLACVDRATFERILARSPSGLHMNFLRSVVQRLRSVNSTFVSELMRSERLSTVGTMANSIIHDLKSPMTVILSCADLVRMRSNDPDVHDFVGLINKAVDKMLDMTQELLDFARGESSLQLERLPAHAVLAEIDDELRRIIPPAVHLVREDDARAHIMVDAGRFARVLLNLVKNAVDAMPQGGILRLTVQQGDDGRVVFQVSDTGVGISDELMARLFEPFVTHGKSKGTGLGLAIAKSVVQAHQGTISVRSKLGAGTVVEITLPAVGPLASAPAGAPAL